MTKLSSKDYRLEWIPVRNLAVVWPEAQRPYKEAWAKEIADNFDPDKFDPVKVTLPNGNGIYHICEGQHRKNAVELLWGPNEMVPCIIAEEADPARAAEIFLGINADGRNYVTKVEKFKVAVVAHRQIETAIDKIVRHNGYRVENSHAQETIGAVDALKFAFNKSPKILEYTLRVLRDTWGGDPAAVSAVLIKGYSTLICEFFADIDYSRLRDSVVKARYSPNQLAVEAKGVKETLHITSVAAVVHILLRVYNGRGCRRPLKRKGT